jgi:pimeloyl-ACP methyl ester carboxylesterase
VTFESLEGINTIRDFAGFTSSGMRLWERSVPGIEDIDLEATADGAEQPALWLPPVGDRDRPLLVILHSWSSDYRQHAGIPYAMWAQENGWAVIAPNFRGVNDDVEAIGSDLAVQDVVDAIDYATSQSGVDSEHVYAVGYSGGGMMALLLAGRHPEKVSAVAAWGPPYDLVDFYRQSLGAGRSYAWQIRAGCGGDPATEGSAREECFHRSPVTHLDAAREAGVPVYIGQGIYDSLLWPSHGARAFNQLADPDGRLDDDQVARLEDGALPDALSGSVTTETYFGEGDPTPVFGRRSGDAWLVYFNSGHDMVYGATARWFAAIAR